MHQDPKVFCLSCSDSRVDAHEIFDMMKPGGIFEVKNVGGLFSDDAKAGLVYALNHLNPEYIVVMHHSRCGGYRSVSDDVESEIKRHMFDNGGFHAKVRVEGHLNQLGLKLPTEWVERLIIEEGCRIQAESIGRFLALNYPVKYRQVASGMVKILPLLYDVVSGVMYTAPNKLEGSEDMVKDEF